jgi:hypothetical protein
LNLLHMGVQVLWEALFTVAQVPCRQPPRASFSLLHQR